MNQPQPSAYQIQQSRRGSGGMNELDGLRVRSIELETELRLTKEQLLQAQSGSQYLVNCVANQQNGNIVRGVSQNHFALENRNQQLETEVHRLKGQLLVQSRERQSHVRSVPAKDANTGRVEKSGGWGSTKERGLEKEVAKLQSQRASLLNDVLHLLKKDAHEYSFRFDDGDPAIYKPLEHFKTELADAQVEETWLLDGEITESDGDLDPFIDEKAAERKNRIDSGLTTPTPMAKKPSIYVKPGDVALLDLDSVEQARYDRHTTREARSAHQPGHVPQQHPMNRSPRQAPFAQPHLHHPMAQHPPTPPYERRERRPFGGSQGFAPFEHNYLMSNATFIEEKDAEEYLEFWESLEDERRFAGRHTKEEWKLYYEVAVRPVFLQKMAERERPVAEVRQEIRAVEKSGAHADSVEVAIKVDDAPTETEREATEPVVAAEGAATHVRGTTPAEDEIERSTRSEEPAPKPAGMMESCWAVLNDKADSEAVAVQTKQSFEVTARVEEPGVPTRLHQKREDEAVVMPAVPAFGSLDLLPKPAPSATYAPIPGLAGGWPRPISRSISRPVLSAPSRISEKDPGAWNNLFFGIERKSERVFILGKNEHLFRTAVITGVPVGTKLVKVLDKVRGGKIVGAKFLDTAGMKMNPPMTTNTVLLEFLISQRAKAFVDHGKAHPISFGAGDEVAQTKADVQLIRTHTIPLPQRTQAQMLQAEGTLTRVLFIIFTVRENALAPDALAREITMLAAQRGWWEVPKHPLRIIVEEDGRWLFEYADVEQAAAAWNAVDAMQWKLPEISKGFAADPCGRAFETDDERKEGKDGVKEAAEKGEQPAVKAGEELKDDELEAEAKAKLMEG